MRPPVRLRRRCTLALAALAACTARLPHPLYEAQPTAALESVGYPPPPARVEIVPARPSPRAVWIDGEWAWQGRRWAWRIGRWVEPPAGARYAPWTVVRGDDGSTYYAPGAWRDAKGGELPDPAAIATGRPDLQDVVDPEGELEQTGRSIRPVSETRDAGAPEDADMADAEAGIDAGGE
jgi:hypothetical protein